MSGDQDENKGNLSADAITEECLDLSRGITDDDKLLWKRDKNAVDFSLNYAKLWCKFCKELIVTLEKKATIENESCRSLSKQMQSLDSTISSSSMIGSPLRSETIAMTKLIIEQSKEIEVQNSKKLGKLLDVINRQRTEFSKTRKHYKEKWKSDCKKMSDAENFMLKTRASYYQRCQQGMKLREDLTSSQSLLTYMLDHGIQDFSSLNATAVTNATGQCSTTGATSTDLASSVSALPGSATSANDAISASQLSKQKVKVDKLEKQLSDNDKKEIEMMYAYKESVDAANNRLIEFEKKKLEHLCDIRLTTARNDEVVKDTLAEYLRILFDTRTSMLKEYALLSDKFQEYKPCQEFKNLIEKHSTNKPEVYAEKFQVELFHDSAAAKDKSDSQTGKGASLFSIGTKEPEHDSSHRSGSGNRGILTSHSESDSDSEIISSNETTGPSGSKGAGVLNTIVEFGSNLFRQGAGNSGGGTPFENRRNQSQLKNKKSTSGSTSSMSGNTDGVLSDKDIEWQKEVEAVIEVALKCINIIELNGLTTHGIYRVSASKLKVTSVMEALNSQGADANLECEQATTLASVVKSKLIALSEPLIPYNLYTEFVDLGKEAEVSDSPELVAKLNCLLQQLPPINKKLGGLIFHHLKRIANNSGENQMGSTNLGTLFAPTLIKSKPRFRMADIKEYMDNKSQAKIVQLIIENVEELFGNADQYYVLCKSSSIDECEIQDANKSDTIVLSKPDVAQKPSRPRSNIIESLDSPDGKVDSSSARPLSGSFMTPETVATISTESDKPVAPRTLDAFLGPDISNNIRAVSPRLRERKLAGNHKGEREQLVVAATKYPDKEVASVPHRSISVGSGPSLNSIKLVQLSKPSNDSIFSKSKEVDCIPSMERTSSFNIATDRSNALKKSFLYSHESRLISRNTSNSSDTSNTEFRFSSVKNNQLSSSTRLGSSAARNHLNHTNDFELPMESHSCQTEHNTLFDTELLYDPILLASSAPKHFIDISPDKLPKIRPRSHASPTETGIVRNRIKSHPYSPFIRHSNLRTAFIVRSLSDLRVHSLSLCNSPFANQSPLAATTSHPATADRRSRLKKFCSVDNIQCPDNSKNNRQIEKYQDWLSRSISSEFFV